MQKENHLLKMPGFSYAPACETDNSQTAHSFLIFYIIFPFFSFLYYCANKLISRTILRSKFPTDYCLFVPEIWNFPDSVKL